MAIDYALTYDMNGQPMRIGDRVEIHPRFDLWMRGARFGTVHKIQTSNDGKQIAIAVRMDHKQVRKLFRCSSPLDLKVIK